MDKRYEEALDRARQGLPIDKIFPELNESEDERIRKELIEYLTHRAEVTGFIDEDKDCKRWIAYLERQKEQKPVQSDTEKELVLHDTFGYEEGRQTGQNEGIKLVLNNPEMYGLQKEQKPAEWSEEDEEMLDL